MRLDDALSHVAILGAAGKMGRGISLLLLQEIARLDAFYNGEVGSGKFRLILIDSNPTLFPSLKRYLKQNLVKYAEKKINDLRKYYVNNLALVSNQEVVEAFTEGALELVDIETSAGAAANSTLVFEAIAENVEIKAHVLGSILASSKTPPFFLTNTSSIPINLLNNRAKLSNRIIGFHFYNPPAIQKLVELIASPSTDTTLKELALGLAKRLDKIVIESGDVAGFIGNGHFIREIAYACKKVEEMSQTYSIQKAVYLLNRITQEWLIRPMGIFQLIDYVGLDICWQIAAIMSEYLSQPLTAQMKLIAQMLERGLKGGIRPDGSQQDGFFRYEGLKPVAIYAMESKRYEALTEDKWEHLAQGLSDNNLMTIPQWKQLQNDPERISRLSSYFQSLEKGSSLGAQLARDFLTHSKSIAKGLVKDKVANTLGDVDQVLMNGFFHVYGSGSIPEWVSTVRAI